MEYALLDRRSVVGDSVWWSLLVGGALFRLPFRWRPSPLQSCGFIIPVFVGV